MKKGTKQLSALDRIVIETCERKIRSGDGREMSVIEAIVAQDVPAALQGNDRAKKRLWADYARASDRKAELDAADIEWAQEEQRKCFELFATAERLGLPAPGLLPHPAHVRVTDDEIIFTGPITADERASWEFTKAEMRHWSRLVATLREMIKKDPSQEAEFLLRKIRALVERLRRTISPGWDWKESIYTLGSSPEELARYREELERRLERASPEVRRKIDEELASWRSGQKGSSLPWLKKTSKARGARTSSLHPA
jgi:hypothetical protein